MSDSSCASGDSGYGDNSDEVLLLMFILRYGHSLTVFLTQEELALVGHSVRDCTDSDAHELKTAPVMTRHAYLAAGGQEVFPQRGLLGTVVESSYVPCAIQPACR